MSAQYYTKRYQPPYEPPQYRHEQQPENSHYSQQGHATQQSTPQQSYYARQGYYQQPSYPQGNQQIIIQQPQSRSNGLGIAGFILALLGLISIIVPVLGIVLMPGFGFLGFIFSIIGVFKSPRGFAIAGLVISFAILLIMILGGAAVLSIPSLFKSLS